jgi:hypothetical protein
VHARGVDLRGLVEGVGAAARRHPGDVDDVLHRDGHAVQRATSWLGVACPRLRERALGVDVHERRPLVLRDPGERRLDQLYARRARPDRRLSTQPGQR